MRELRRAASGEEALSDERLIALCNLLWDHVYDEGQGPDGAPWSEALGLLAAQLEGRPEQDNWAALAAQAHATRFDREGRRAEALAVLEAAIERHRDRPYAMFLHIDLGALLRDEHEFGRALTELRAAQALIEESKGRLVDPSFEANRRVFEAVVASELGAAQETLGMTDSAADSFERADELASALDDTNGPSVYGGNLMYRLNLALNRERWNEVQSLRGVYEAHAWRDLVPDMQAQAIRARFAIADVAAASRGSAPPGTGEAELRSLLQLELSPDEELRATAFLAESLLDRGALEEARQTLATAHVLIGATQGQEPRRLHVLGLSARLLRADGAPRERQEAFLSGELRPGFEAFLAEAQRGPLEEAGISLLYNDWMRAALCELFELELSVDEDGEGSERAFTWLARLHAVGTFSREHGLGAPSLAVVREALLIPGRGLLVYVPGRSTSYAFALDDAGLAVHRLGPAWALDDAARQLEETIQSVVGAPSARSHARLAASVAEATEAFVPSGIAATLLRWRSVTVAGLDDFGYVPLEALQPAGGEAIGTTHEVTYQPSIPVGVWLARRAAERPPTAGPAVLYVAQGDPALAGRTDLAPVRVDPERLGGAAFARAGVPWRLLGPDDAPELAGALSGARLATFLAHGLYDEERVRPAGLLLAPEEEEGAWFADTLEGLSSPPVTVVAACGTDRAPLRRGDDGRGHLRASFFRVGGDCVATATLALDLEAAVALIGQVNERLAAGDSVAAAFHAARLAPQPGGVHPVHAHLLHVFGAGDARPVASAPAKSAVERPADPARTTWPWALTGAVGLLLALAALRLRASASRSPRRG